MSDPISSENNDLEDKLSTKLKSSLNMRDLCSDKGAIFEIEKNKAGDSSESFNSVRSVSEYNDAQIWSVCYGADREEGDNSISEAEDIEPFEKLAHNMEDISGDGGVLKMELYPGSGGDLPERARVLFHYSAFLEFADEPFDSTLLRGRPQQAHLDADDVLSGLRIALRTMRKKEHARFLVRAEYAFGRMGCPPRIPGGATVLYEITLLDVVDASAAVDFENLDFEQQKAATFEDKMKAAKTYHQQGNEHYRANRLLKAKNCYRKAAWILEYASLKNEEEEKQRGHMIFRMHSNLAQVNLDLKEPKRACTECRLALEVYVKPTDEMKGKIFYRYAKAKMYLNDFPDARKYIRKAQRLLPNSNEIASLMENLLRREHMCKEKEVIMCQKMMQMNSKPKIADTAVTQIGGRTFEPSTNGLVERDVQSPHHIMPELKSALRIHLKNFADNPFMNEHTFPPNLSKEELDFVFEVAQCLKVTLKKFYVGSQIVWKAVKEPQVVCKLAK